MAYKKKTWVDRLVEYAGRRKITNVSTMQSQIVDVERAEGIVSKEGTAFSAATMNDLEQRIADGFSGVQGEVDGLNRDLQSFQTGVDALYNKCVSLGVTPTGKTLSAITAALEAVYNKGKKDAEYKVIIKVYGVGGSADSVGSGQYTVTATSGTGSYRQGDGDTRVDISRG